jgi:hypothetical protein
MPHGVHRAISDNAQKLALYFVLARPDSNQDLALAYAAAQLPKSPVHVARFLIEWLKLRDQCAAIGRDEGMPRYAD